MQFLVAFLIALVFSVATTFVVRKVALRFDIVDHPNLERKKHTKPTPLLGGVALYTAFAAALMVWSLFDTSFFEGYLAHKHIVGLLLGGLIIIGGGALDDIRDLKPWQQFLFPIIASVVVVASGMGIEYISNPFGEGFSLNQLSIDVLTINAVPYQLTLFADVFAILWLVGMMYTTKILDGMDGLVTGLTVIAAVVLFVLSLSEQVMQPETAVLAALLAGAFLGFLFYNFNPANIFLGEAGSLFAGFGIGVISIISGGKLATALLIFSIPIIDLLFVIIERIMRGESPFSNADTKHLHFRLQEFGLSVRQVVLVFYTFSVLMGVIALQFNGRLKIVLLSGVFVVVFVLLFLLSRSLAKRGERRAIKP